MRRKEVAKNLHFSLQYRDILYQGGSYWVDQEVYKRIRHFTDRWYELDAVSKHQFLSRKGGGG